MKLLLTLNAAEVADSESLDVYSEYSRVLAALSWFDFGIVLPLAVFGVWQSRAAWKRLALLYAVLLVLMLSVAAFFVLARYRYPAVPVALLFAACGVSTIVPLRRDTVRGTVPGLVLGALAAVVAHLPLPSVYRDTTLFNVGLGYLKTDRPAEAVSWLEQAVQRQPDDAAAFFALGVAYDRVGQSQQAVDALSASVRQRPDDWEARNALGLALQGRGRNDEALPHLLEACASARCGRGVRPWGRRCRSSVSMPARLRRFDDRCSWVRTIRPRATILRSPCKRRAIPARRFASSAPS